MRQSPVVHFEMPAKDKKRVIEFYSKVFGWDMIQLGAEMSNYILAGTTPTDENQMAQKPGEINGGFFEYADMPGLNVPHIVIQVENLDEAMEKVKNSGGKINDSDKNLLLASWSPNGPAPTPALSHHSADLNGDGFVNEKDLTVLFYNWNL